ncbi:protein N-terminal glutamine amidohydrolase [Biomphalaria glabrata]|nr:protein N-terminal glutamine amidohydrolase-like [Biomphalaria glabrata]
MVTVPDVIPQADMCTYTACYCEENVWKLCEMVKERCTEYELMKCFCVFISNSAKKVPLWHQKASRNPERLVVWDYHVIFMYYDTDTSLVYDLDTELGFPCTLKEYVSACIGDERTLKKQFWRMFRVIPALEYLSTFASDRSHMLNDEKEWLATPPKYPPIKCLGVDNNISEFISMDQSTNHGDVFNLQQFLSRFQL